MAKFRNGLAKVGKVYHYCFTLHGKQFKGSTRATDRASAELVLASKRKEALLGPQEKPLPALTVKELVAAWVASYRTTYSPRHIESVEGFAKVWILPAMGGLALNQIGTQAVLDLRTKMLDARRSPATANLLLRILKLLRSFADRLGHQNALPFQVKPLRVQRKPRTTIPATAVPEFIAVAGKVSRNPQVAIMLRVHLALGLREREVLEMRWSWFDPEQMTYTPGRTKGKEARVIPVPAWLWTQLMGMPRQLTGWVFPAADGSPHRRGYLRKPLEKIQRLMGLKGLHLHRLRASFATLHSQAGTPLREIAALMGHKDPALTARVYLEETLDSRRTAQNALSKRLGLA